MVVGWIFLGVGAFVVGAALRDWNWFFAHRKSRHLMRLFGRTGTRIFYGALGGALFLLGLLAITGIIPEMR